MEAREHLSTDGDFANGVSSEELLRDVYPKDKDSDEKQIQERQMQANLTKTAQERIDAINDELQRLCYLPDFIQFAGGLPSDLEARKVCNKLELRFVHINQLILQRNEIQDAVNDSDFDLPISIRPNLTIPDEIIVKTEVEPRPRRFAAIKQGIKDIIMDYLK